MRCMDSHDFSVGILGWRPKIIISKKNLKKINPLYSNYTPLILYTHFSVPPVDVADRSWPNDDNVKWEKIRRMKTKRYFYNLYKTFYSWRKKLISCCLVLLRNAFSWWRTEMRCMTRPLATARLHWILCVTTFHKLANIEQMVRQCFDFDFDSSKGSEAKLYLQLQNAPEAYNFF